MCLSVKMSLKYKTLRNSMFATLGATVLINDYGKYFNHGLANDIPKIATVGIGATIMGKTFLDFKDIYTSVNERSAPSDEETKGRFTEGIKNVVYGFILPLAVDAVKGVISVGNSIKSSGVNNFVNRSMETLNSNSFIALIRGADDVLLISGLSMIACGAAGYLLKESMRKE